MPERKFSPSESPKHADGPVHPQTGSAAGRGESTSDSSSSPQLHSEVDQPVAGTIKPASFVFPAFVISLLIYAMWLGFLVFVAAKVTFS